MARRLDLTPLVPFDPLSDPTSLSQRWKTWKRRFETYLVALDIKEDTQKRALLLYQAGEATQEIFDTLQDTGDDKDYKKALEKLDEYFSPKKNIDYEIFQFRQAKQKIDETTDQFATRLRKLAAHCEFENVNNEVKSAIIQNCRSKRLRRFALREAHLTLENLLSKARALENSEQQAQGIEKQLASTNIHDEFQEANRISRTTRNSGGKSLQCRNCGLTWPHNDSPCPAKGQTCHKCKKLNHYARVCRSSVDRSTQNRTWASERQSNHQTKQRIHRVEPENEAEIGRAHV